MKPNKQTKQLEAEFFGLLFKASKSKVEKAYKKLWKQGYHKQTNNTIPSKGFYWALGEFYIRKGSYEAWLKKEKK